MHAFSSRFTWLFTLVLLSRNFGFGLLPHFEVKQKFVRTDGIMDPPTIGEHIKREWQIRGLRQIDVADALQ